MTHEPNIFQKIIQREVPADIVYEDDFCLAFRDVDPQAPVHVLVIPKKPVVNVHQLEDQHEQLAGRLLLAVRNTARQLGIEQYRIVANCGKEAGQSVDHLHLHLLAGRSFSWPPG